MKPRCSGARFVALIVAFLLLALCQSAHAQRLESAEAFVYGITATTPGELFGTFSPPQVEEIYVLAGRVSVLSPRRTRVFFWPITQEYRADWSRLNEPLDGVLEIMRHNRVIETVIAEPYTAHYKAAGTTLGRLYVGGDAVEVEARFLESRAAYQQALKDYGTARTEWLARVRATQQDETTQPPQASEPLPPPALTVYSVGLHQGFPLKLEAGTYQIHMRQPDGNVASGSQRILRVFEPRRSVLGYEVIPEERWTYPVQANALTDAIVAGAGSVIYLRPRVAHEVPALAYERLRDAQYTGEVDAEWRWVAGEGDDAWANTTLEIVRDGLVVERLAKASFHVRQASEQRLGYEIVPFNPRTPELTPRVDFSGFRLQLPSGRAGFAVRLRPLVGAPYTGSTRQVRVMPASVLPVLAPTALLAVVFGLTLLVVGRRFRDPTPRHSHSDFPVHT